MNGKPARMVPLSEEENKAVLQLCLLTMKPVIFAANVSEADLADASGNPHVDKVKKCAADLNAEVVVVSAQVHSRVFTIWNYVSRCNISIICGSLHTSIFVVFWGHRPDAMLEFHGPSHQYFPVNNIYYVILKERLLGAGRGGTDRT